MCKLFNDAGTIVIASFISPFIADRSMAKNIIGAENFVEVYVNANLSVCQQRDTKGLYKLALEGKVKNFTGISSPYEPPVNPDIHIRTDSKTIEQCLAEIKEYTIRNERIKLPTAVYY
jgi:adenylylsulfate kinase-like enzyme